MKDRPLRSPPKPEACPPLELVQLQGRAVLAGTSTSVSHARITIGILGERGGKYETIGSYIGMPGREYS